MLVVFNSGIWGETLIPIFFILQLHDAFSIVLSPSLKSSVSWLAEQKPFSERCRALDSRVTSSTEPLMCSYSHVLEAFDLFLFLKKKKKQAVLEKLLLLQRFWRGLQRGVEAHAWTTMSFRMWMWPSWTCRLRGLTMISCHRWPLMWDDTTKWCRVIFLKPTNGIWKAGTRLD